MRSIALAVFLLGASPCFLALRLGEAYSVLEHTSDIIVDWTTQKAPVIRAFSSPSPEEYQKLIDENKNLLRAKILLDNSTTIEFRERPKDIDFYDSTVVVNRQGGPSKTYNVGELTKHQALSLAHVAIIPSMDGLAILICEYEGGFVGAKEGFAILRLTRDSFDFQTLPLSDFGKIVVYTNKPNQVTVWSALPYPRGTDAEPMAYSVQLCRWDTKSYVCGTPKRQRTLSSPASVNDPGIEILP